MSCRQWLSSAMRQCQSVLARPQPSRALSTSAPAAAGFKRTPSDTPSRPSGPAHRMAPRQPNHNAGLQGLVSEGMGRRGSAGPLSSEERRGMLGGRGRGSGEQARGDTRAHIQDMRQNTVTENYARQMPRRWRAGDAYSPRDLSPYEMGKWRKSRRPDGDVVDILGFNPVDNYKNFALISEFMTSAGRIKHSRETGLRPVNQRKMAKAIRRAIGMGLHPSVHKHPELLRFGSRQGNVAAVPSTSDPSQARL
ncbi:ribosomal protein S18 [Staphylotrichum tortipilum]|uniref:Small ribosomal subunit protein bS18m n=1 Tax=Staphylotrichum tortipilum TaxID=2831512 RepID=A0AAN6RRS5_9PEZI|nr:ribosomal protein S18 [Staphylotrichum longicolle]